MTRNQRVTLELFGPMVLYLVVDVVVIKGDPLLEMARGGIEGVVELLWLVGHIVLTTGLAASVPSILYALVMEWRFGRGLEPRSWRSVGLSSLLGFAAGAGACLPFFGLNQGFVFMSLYFGAHGLAVGLAMGLLIRWLSPRQPPLLATH